MKITKARLRQIIKEEMSEASEIDFTGGIEPGVDPAASKETDLGAAIEAAARHSAYPRKKRHRRYARSGARRIDGALAEMKVAKVR